MQLNYSESRELTNPLSLLQSVNLYSAQNTCNSLNYLDYNESLGLPNWLILFNSVDSTESHNLLIAQKRMLNILLEVPVNNEESYDDDGKYHDEENHDIADLQDTTGYPDPVYGRVVTDSHDISWLALI